MKTTVTGRHIEVTPALKAYVEERINHLARYSNQATEASVILTVEKYRHQADVTVNVNGTVVQATGETSEMYASIDQAVEKIERQIKKLKDRLHDHRQRVEPLPVDEESAFHVAKLPDLHRDPFDRLLVAQALVGGLVVLTPDDPIREYPVRSLW